MTTNTQKGQLRKAQILQTAIELLEKDGAQAFSMRTLAQACKLTLSNVQYYFKTPETLFQALLEKILEQASFKLHQAIQNGDDALDALIQILFSETDFQKNCQLLWDVWGIAQQHESTNKVIIEFYQNYQFELQRIIQLQNKKLTPSEAKNRAQIILPLLEGVFVVYGKDRKKQLAPSIEKNLLKTIRLIIHSV